MEKRNKTRTFIGFAVKSKNLRTGMNTVLSLKRAELILVCKSASENTVKQARSAADKFKCPMLISKCAPLEEMIYKENVKIAAVTDKRLAQSIKDNAEEEFTVGN